jgi:hypothetical protein
MNKPIVQCPSCQRRAVPIAKPSAGDFTVCIGCGMVLRFADDHSIRLCTDDDFRELNTEPEIATAADSLRRRHGGANE